MAGMLGLAAGVVRKPTHLKFMDWFNRATKFWNGFDRCSHIYVQGSIHNSAKLFMPLPVNGKRGMPVVGLKRASEKCRPIPQPNRPILFYGRKLLVIDRRQPENRAPIVGSVIPFALKCVRNPVVFGNSVARAVKIIVDSVNGFPLDCVDVFHSTLNATAFERQQCCRVRKVRCYFKIVES